MSSANVPKFWFHAKRYGWGWGLPAAWQGWVVLIMYVTLVLGGIPLIHATQGNVVYLAYLVALTVAFIAICWLTGEPPGGRSGKRDV
jgi:hypothetical protein